MVLIVLINLWALWLSGTRGAVIGIGSGALVFSLGYVFWGQLRTVRWAALGVLVAAFLSIVLFFTVRSTTVLDPVVQSSNMLGRLTTIGAGDSSIKGRIVSVEAGLKAYLDRPLLGWGPENYLIAWGKYFNGDADVRTRFDQAHSKVVEALTTTGAAGFLSYMAIWVAIFCVLFHSARRRQAYSQLFTSLMGATLVAYFVQNLFLFDTTTTTMHFAILVAFVVSEEGWVREQEQPADPGRGQRPSGAAGGKAKWSPRQLPTTFFNLTRTLPGGALAVAAIASLAVVSLVWFNYRPYAAAAATLNSTKTSLSWNERLAQFSRAADLFPGLSNYSRIYLLTGLSQDLNSLTDDQLAQAKELVAPEGERGLATEPDNWNLRLSLAQFYQVASTRSQDSLPLARDHLDAAIELAPKTHFTAALKRQQERLEQQSRR